VIGDLLGFLSFLAWFLKFFDIRCYFLPDLKEYNNKGSNGGIAIIRMKKSRKGVTTAMLKIILCDDDPQDTADLYQLLRYELFDKEDFEVRSFSDGADLIRAVEQEPEFYADLIFLDIRMPQMNGMQTAQWLRDRQLEADIIFVTGHSEYVYQGYEVHAYDYILKPMTAQKLEKVMTRYVKERHQESGERLLVSKNTGIDRVSLKHVCYFVSDKRKVRAVMEPPYESVEFYRKLGELEEELQGNHFIRVHQSFLINTQKIQSRDKSGIWMANQDRIPVSRRYRDAVAAHMDQITYPRKS